MEYLKTEYNNSYQKEKSYVLERESLRESKTLELKLNKKLSMIIFLHKGWIELVMHLPIPFNTEPKLFKPTYTCSLFPVGKT